MSLRGQLKGKIPTKTVDNDSRRAKILAFIRDNSPCTAAEIAEALALPKRAVTNACAALQNRSEIYRQDTMYHVGSGRVETVPVERHIPGYLGLTKHWTQDVYIDPSRLAAFSLPSLVAGERVYPKGYPA